MNVTNSTVADDDVYADHAFWVDNSAAIIFTPEGVYMTYIGIALGVVCLIHSYAMNANKFSTVRIWSDISAVVLILQSILIIIPIKYDLGYSNTVIINAVTLLVSALIQVTDNYLTFVRYSIIVDGTSPWFQKFVFVYAILFLYVPWIPATFFLPFFINMNTDPWLSINSILGIYIYFYAYLAYDLMFFFPLVYHLYLTYEMDATVVMVLKKKVLLEVTIRALVHTCFSMLAMLFYAFVAPLSWGGLQYSLCSF